VVHRHIVPLSCKWLMCKWVLMKGVTLSVWCAFTWPMTIRTKGRLLWSWLHFARFYTSWATSSLGERLSTSQEGPCFLGLVKVDRNVKPSAPDSNGLPVTKRGWSLSESLEKLTPLSLNFAHFLPVSVMLPPPPPLRRIQIHWVYFTVLVLNLSVSTIL
jgi:hypothetical protein